MTLLCQTLKKTKNVQIYHYSEFCRVRILRKGFALAYAYEVYAHLDADLHAIC